MVLRTAKGLMGLCIVVAFGFCVGNAWGEEVLREEAVQAMVRATRFFRTEVAANGGYLWKYKSDFSLREGEGTASPSTIWVQPPGTPSVGMAYLEAYEATGDAQYLDAARDAAYALVWGQLASGGWDYRINFDPEGSRRWYYRRNLDGGEARQDRQRNTTVLDDNTTQSALRLLMQVDKTTGFEDEKIHGAAMYALNALIKAQYPNGAWPQRYTEFPNPDDFPVKKARYPETWSRTFPRERYSNYYTFNDNAMSDVIRTMVEAYHTYGDSTYLATAVRGGEFMLLSQMPDPQPAWAQQYNTDMEPAWARRFEPPSISGGESFGVMRTLMDLYVETGDERFLEPIPRALAWAKRSVLPDGGMARFYELETNRPLYFTVDYVLTYSDADMPTHYAFKVSGSRIASTEAYYERIREQGRKALQPARRRPRQGTDETRVKEAIASLDDQGRWVEQGNLRHPEKRRERIEAEIISCRTFVRNLSLLARYVADTRP